jgi:preprotein translocase subunit SecE
LIERVCNIAGGNDMQRLTKFLRNVVREMKKVSWPKRKELTRYTITVVSTVTFVAVFFAVIDLGISSIIRLILE